MVEKFINITFYMDLPDASKQDIVDWLEYQLNYSKKITLQNPCIKLDIEPKPFSLIIDIMDNGL